MHVEAVGGEAGGQTEHATEAVVAAVQLVVTVDHPEETSPVVLCVEFVAKFFQMLLPDVVRFTVSFTLTTAVVPKLKNKMVTPDSAIQFLLPHQQFMLILCYQ